MFLKRVLVVGLICANSQSPQNLQTDFFNSQERAHLLLMEEHKYEEAVELCNRWLKAGKNAEGALACRADTHAALGRYEMALRDINLAIAKDPSCGAFYDERADIYSRMGNYVKAIESWRLGLAHLNHLPGGTGTWEYKNIGLTYLKIGQIQSAIEHYSLAIKLDSDDVEAQYLRACAYENDEQHELALQDFAQVIHKEPDWKAAYQHRAIIFEKTDQTAKAKAEWRLANAHSSDTELGIVHLLTPLTLTEAEVTTLRNAAKSPSDWQPSFRSRLNLRKKFAPKFMIAGINWATTLRA